MRQNIKKVVNKNGAFCATVFHLKIQDFHDIKERIKW